MTLWQAGTVRRWSRRALIAFASLLTFYAVVIGVLFLFQRSLIYHPVKYSIAPAAGGPAIQAMEIATADGERLVGWWSPPDAGRPTILFFNGNGGSLAAQSGRWRRIAEAGVGFLAIAYVVTTARQDGQPKRGCTRTRVLDMTGLPPGYRQTKLSLMASRSVQEWRRGWRPNAPRERSS